MLPARCNGWSAPQRKGRPSAMSLLGWLYASDPKQSDFGNAVHYYRAAAEVGRPRRANTIWANSTNRAGVCRRTQASRSAGTRAPPKEDSRRLNSIWLGCMQKAPGVAGTQRRRASGQNARGSRGRTEPRNCWIGWPGSPSGNCASCRRMTARAIRGAPGNLERQQRKSPRGFCFRATASARRNHDFLTSWPYCCSFATNKPENTYKRDYK